MTACPKCGYCAEATVIGMWTLKVPKVIRSLNSRSVNAGVARYAYKRNRTAWQWALKVERINHRVPIAHGKRRVTITRVYAERQRELDRDNLVGGAKVAVDAMALEGLIAGDDPARAEIHYLQVRGTTRETIVLIEELG